LDVFIHIGAPKSGSSAIQASLWAGRRALSEAGILYHPAEKGDGHYCYSVVLGGKTRGDDRRHEELTRKNVVETRARIESEGPRALVLSGETLFHREPEKLDSLCGDITGEPNRLHVLAFIRHPVPLYLSQIQQELTGSQRFTHPRQFKPRMAEALGRWMRHPSITSLSVRLFDRSRLADGSVIAETTAVMREVFGDHVPNLPEAIVDASLTSEQMSVMQGYRRDFLAARDNQYDLGAHNTVRLFHGLNRSVGRVRTKPALIEPMERFIADHNAGEIEAVDELLPDLRMGTSHSTPVASWEGLSVSWNREDVGTILRHVDTDWEKDLRGLLVEYMGCAEEEIPARAVPILAKLGIRARPEYQMYLERAGLPAARAAVGTISRSDFRR